MIELLILAFRIWRNVRFGPPDWPRWTSMKWDCPGDWGSK